MKIVSQALDARSHRANLLKLGLAFGLLISAYIVSQFIIANDFTGFIYIGLSVVAAVVVFAILKNWRNGLYFFLAWLLFEDLARKFLGNNMAIYFAKDVIVAVIYLAFFISYPRSRKDEIKPFLFPFRVALFVLVLLGLWQIVVPLFGAIRYEILGSKLYF